MNRKTFFFYDLETSGLKAREDRIMQFAGQRTTLELEPIGEPVNILVKMTDDALPSPGAIAVTKITPQDTLRDGMSEAEFCRLVSDEVFVPGTIAVGYNTVRFDDEFMRAILWRNFYDAYEWEWRDERSRWDILDAVRLTRALRPEGIEWPFTEDGRATNRLELITKLNGVSHEHAHDALSDVYATIAVAKLIKEKQPKLFKFLFNYRDKKAVRKIANLQSKKPFVYASGRYSSKYNKTTVVFPLTSGRNGNILVYDLRYNLEDLLNRNDNDTEAVDLAADETGTVAKTRDAANVAVDSEVDVNGERGNESVTATGGYSADDAELETDFDEMDGVRSRAATTIDGRKFFPVVKELCLNKCPAVAPIEVLDVDDGWNKIGLTKEQVQKNLQDLLKHPEFAEQMRTYYEQPVEFPAATEPEAALYDGFLGDQDRIKVSAVRAASEERLADFHPEFDDERLGELLLHYKGRNYPQALSEKEAEQYEKYRQERLKKQAPRFLKELEKIEDEFLRNELILYMQSLQ